MWLILYKEKLETITHEQNARQLSQNQIQWRQPTPTTSEGGGHLLQ
jgi:hypothetical protein